jgi:hypothetical protein
MSNKAQPATKAEQSDALPAQPKFILPVEMTSIQINQSQTKPPISLHKPKMLPVITHTFLALPKKKGHIHMFSASYFQKQKT